MALRKVRIAGPPRWTREGRRYLEKHQGKSEVVEVELSPESEAETVEESLDVVHEAPKEEVKKVSIKKKKAATKKKLAKKS